MLLPLIGGVASLTAIIAPLGSLIIVGICLRLHLAIKARDRKKFWTTVALLPFLPLATLVQGGFIGFGTYWVIAIATFIFAQSRRRVAILLLVPFILFAGLSLFVNYMAARDEIRSMVWYEQSSVSDRLDRIWNVFTNFEWLDFANVRHSGAIDRRLNQNQLVGLAVSRLESGSVQFASGDTLWKMGAALIPRVLWPNKPAVGGGGTVVSDFTGLYFNENTSVGAGQVLEFYVNFGLPGVVLGFLLFGGDVGMDGREGC